MKVAYIGNYRHAHCTEVHIAATLEELGHLVVRVQEDEHSLQQIEDKATGCDLLLYTRTWGLPHPREAIQMFRRLEFKGTKTASYHLDLYVGLKRQVTLRGDPFWATQFVFTPDGSDEAAKVFADKGINHHYIKPGVFKPQCVPGDLTPRFQHDVVFVGSYPYPHPEWPYRNRLVEWLAHTYGNDFARYGGGAEVVRDKPLNDLYASAKVVVGDSVCLGFTRPYYWSDRVYETVGRGGFLIHPHIEGLEEEFTDGAHLRLYDYNDFNHLRDIIDHYLTFPAEARLIADAGQAHVRENCTYHNRLTQALAIVTAS